MNSQTRRFAIVLLLAACCAGCKTMGMHSENSQELRRVAASKTLATYCNAPRRPDGRVDVGQLMIQLKSLHANTYSFCIHRYATDWDDLQLMLPVARKNGIKIWASIVPPSESPPRNKAFAEPFRLDYEKWAVEFAKLSLREPSLVAWSIDDFTYNLKTYTPEYLGKMIGASRGINPRLAFIPCCYYPAITPEFAANYAGLLDGILFPYRHESAGANLKDPGLLAFEVQHVREITGQSLPIFVDIYSAPHSRLGATTVDYIDQALAGAEGVADGVMIYTHPDPDKYAAKSEVIRRRFVVWHHKRVP